MAQRDNNVLLSFVMQEKENGNPIPASVSDFLLDGLLHHVDAKATVTTDENEFERFSDKFELHIRKLKETHKCQTKSTKQKDWDGIIKKKIAHYNDLMDKKRKESDECVMLLNTLLKMKITLEKKLEEAILYENAGLDVDEVKQRVLLSKASDSILNETSQTVEALKKLKEYLETRKKELNILIEDLEDSEIRYNEIKDNPEFLKLLSDFNKLLKRKQLIEANRD